MLATIKGTGVPVICCGEEMQPLVPGTSDGAYEKHLPVYEMDGSKVCVKVGSAPHPMAEEHYIEWIALKTCCGYQVKFLKPGDAPEACFTVCEGEKVEAVYAFCNLHSLWETEVIG